MSAPATDAGCRRDGDALRFSGALDRAAAVLLWTQASQALDGVRRFDLDAVSRVDSAGLALLGELAARLRQGGTTVQFQGQPPGLSELSAAYRLGPALEFPSECAQLAPATPHLREPATKEPG